MKGTVMYDAPRTMYLRSKGTWPRVEREVVHGETNRNWLCGTRSRPGNWKRAKEDWEPCSEAEYDDWEWQSRHRHPISAKVNNCLAVDPATLRKIAELIGYEGK